MANDLETIDLDQTGEILRQLFNLVSDKRSVLEVTDASFTQAEKTKLANSTDSFKGGFTNEAQLLAQKPDPENGWVAWNFETATIWHVEAGVWEDSGSSSVGDMLRASYDPRGIVEDIYDRANHTGLQEQSSVRNLVDNLGTLSARLTAIENNMLWLLANVSSHPKAPVPIASMRISGTTVGDASVDGLDCEIAEYTNGRMPLQISATGDAAALFAEYSYVIGVFSAGEDDNVISMQGGYQSGPQYVWHVWSADNSEFNVGDGNPTLSFPYDTMEAGVVFFGCR